MSLYETLRHFADSWGLVALAMVFSAAVLWVFRPGARAVYRNQAEIPFRNDRKPAGAAGQERDHA